MQWGGAFICNANVRVFIYVVGVRGVERILLDFAVEHAENGQKPIT